MSWEDSYDKWKTTPPEPKESRFKCERCKEPFYPGDRVFDIEGETLCYGCATEWFDEQYRFVQDEDCYGD